MGEQAVDLQAIGSALRRHRRWVAAAGLLGACLGGGLAVAHPPMYTSTTEVLLPTPVVVTPGVAEDTVTQTEIARSQQVLGPAGAAAAPGLSIRQLDERVKVSEPSDQTLVFQVSAPTPGGARSLATAVAKAELAYVARAGADQQDDEVVGALGKLTTDVDGLQRAIRGAARTNDPQIGALTARLVNLEGQLRTMSATQAPTPGTATVIQQATPAVQPGPTHRYLLPTGLGLVGGVAVAFVVCVFAARRDRRLRTRDQLAATVGKPVLASLQGRWAKSTSGWEHLLANYEPEPVDAWALRKLLQQLPSDAEGRRRLTVVSADQDQKGMALGPLLASYAASAGVSTELVATALPASLGLAAAIHRLAGSEPRPCLQVSTAPGDASELTVAVTTDGDPSGPEPLPGPVVIAVAPGAMTAARLIRTAIAAEENGGSLIGIVVVSPDAGDRTVGYLRGHGLEAPRELPRRIPGATPLGRIAELS